MSKITFRHRAIDLKSQTETSLKIRLVVSRECSLEMNSGLHVKPIDWNKPKGTPIKRSTKEYVKLDKDLTNLESHIKNSLDEAKKSNEIIDIQWLRTKVNEFHGITPKLDSSSGLSIYLSDHIKKYIELAPTKKVKNKSALGLAPNTIKKYKTFLGLVLNFERSISKQIKLTEIDKALVEKFKHWLLKIQNYSDNYGGKQIDHLKTICQDAQEYDLPVNKFCEKIESFKQDRKEKYIVTLSLEEIEKIKRTIMPTKSLENAKKWILVGVSCGQRGGDLLSIDLKKITNYDEKGRIYLDVWQGKPQKDVNVVFFDDYVVNIINNDFPYRISFQKLNNYIKDVCAIAGINEIIKGTKYDKATKRKVLGEFPKYELITSHCFRRSFATIWYQRMETSTIMKITGHTKESIFKEYINVRDDKEKDARIFADRAELALEQMKAQNKEQSKKSA